MLARYAHLQPTHLRDAVEQLAGFSEPSGDGGKVVKLAQKRNRHRG
jgi:hypothetical protein